MASWPVHGRSAASPCADAPPPATRRGGAAVPPRPCATATLALLALLAAAPAAGVAAADEDAAPDLELLMYLGLWDEEDAGWLELMHELEPPGDGDDDEQD